MVRQSVIHNYQALKPAGLTLTTIVAAFFERLENYNVERIYDYVDFVHSKLTCLYSDNRDFLCSFQVLSYDYRGTWDKKTGHHAPLRSRPEETGVDMALNVDFSIQYLLSKGGRYSGVEIFS